MYSYEDRIRAVKLYIKLGKRLRATICQVCRPTLYNWKNQLLGREVPASMKRPNDSPPVPDTAEPQRQVELLQQSIHRLQFEHDIWKKANELLKKGLGVHPQLLSNREKTLLVDALKPIYSLTELLGELDLARSSYLYHSPACEGLTNTLTPGLPLPMSFRATTDAMVTDACVRRWADASCTFLRKLCSA